jgi:translation initiation factor 4E
MSQSDIDKALPATNLDKVNVEKPLPLKYKWALWEQLQQASNPAPTEQTASHGVSYTDLTTKVATIEDVQTFWRYFTNLPQPSQILGESKKIVRQDSENGPSNTLAALMLFKEGIRPEWEDSANSAGGHFQFNLQLERTRPIKEGLIGQAASTREQCSSTWLTHTDEYWNNIVLGLIGGSLDPDDFVTGVRLVDKIKPPPKQGGKPVGHIRVEIWFRDTSDSAKVNALRESLETHMRCRIDGTITNEGGNIFPGYKLDMRSHTAKGEGEVIGVVDKTKNPKRNNVRRGETTPAVIAPQTSE